MRQNGRLRTFHGSPTGLSLAVVEAYRNAIYEVDWIAQDVDQAPEKRFLVLDRPCALLEEIFQMTSAAAFAFVTACNPLGRSLTPAENASRHEDLCKAVAAIGHQALPGRGRDPCGSWEPEESLLIVGCSERRAIALGKRFAQNAILVAGEDFVPRLILLR